MSKRGLLITIFDWFSAFLFLATGIVVLILRHNASVYDHIILGSVTLIVGFVKIATYFMSCAFKDPKDISIIVGGAMVALGFIFIFSDYDIASLCFGWGILEIVASGIEIHQKSQMIKHEPLSIVEVVIAVGSLAFAIILCIKTTDALNGHLIFLGISLILLGIYLATNRIIEIIKRKKQ